MRAAMASNLAATALVRKPKVNPGPDDFERIKSEDKYSSQLAVDAIEGPPDTPSSQFASILRTWKLSAMATKEISVDSMRFLFRLLDEDGGGSLSAQEIKNGMLLLGFPEAHDPVALGRLVQSIDEDQTGTVSESEFLSFMSNETRKSLKEKMSKWSLQYTHMQATRYPSSGKLTVEESELSCASMEALVCEALKADQGYNCWVEVVGYDRATFTSLGSALGVSHDELADLLLFSDPVCRTVDSTVSPAACIVLHHTRLSVDPVLPRSGSFLPSPVSALIDFIIGGDTVNIKPPPILRNRRLANKDDITGIAVTLEQVAILVLGSRLIVTLRLPCLGPGSPNLNGLKAAAAGADSGEVRWAPPAPPGGSNYRGPANPFTTDRSEIRLVFERLRRGLPALAIDGLAAAAAAAARGGGGGGGGSGRALSVSAPAAANGDARLLAVLLVDGVVDSLHEVRDRMQDWDELLEASIRGKQCSANTIHLEAMDAVAGFFKAALDPLAEAMKPDKWGGDGDGEEEGGGGDGEEGLGWELPHTLRGFLSSYSIMTLRGDPFQCCTACSPKVIGGYRRGGWDFIKQALDDTNFLADTSGLTELLEGGDSLMADEWDDLSESSGGGGGGGGEAGGDLSD